MAKKFKFNLKQHWWIVALAVVGIFFILKGKGFIGAVMTPEEKTLCEGTGGTLIKSDLMPEPTIAPNKELTYVPDQTNVYPFCALCGFGYTTAEDFCIAHPTVDTVTQINDDLTLSGHPCGTDVNNFNIILAKKYYVSITANTLLDPGDTVCGDCGAYVLQEGWNDFLLVQEGSYDVVRFLNDLEGKYEIAWAYDCTDDIDHWKMYDPDPALPEGINNLDVIDERHSYILMVKMTESTQFVSDRIIETGSCLMDPADPGSYDGCVFGKYWLYDDINCPVPRAEICDCGEWGIWDPVDGCGYITGPECTTDADCPQDTCFGAGCINGFCEQLTGMPAPPNCPGESYYGELSDWVDCDWYCQPPLCDFYCYPSWSITNGECIYNECLEGCGPDYDMTFYAEEECECELDEGLWIYKTLKGWYCEPAECETDSDCDLELETPNDCTLLWKSETIDAEGECDERLCEYDSKTVALMNLIENPKDCTESQIFLQDYIYFIIGGIAILLIIGYIKRKEILKAL